MEENKFSYTYSALSEKEKRTIKSIKALYEDKKEENKFEKLQRLNARVNNLALTVGLTVGILGCLVFGLGLSMILEWQIYVWGVFVSVIGAIPMSLAYFAYKITLKKQKQKYGKQIIELSNQLLNEDEK